MGKPRLACPRLTHKNDDVSSCPRIEDPCNETGEEVEMAGSQARLQPFNEPNEIARNGDCSGSTTENLRISVLGDWNWSQWHVMVVRRNFVCVDGADESACVERECRQEPSSEGVEILDVLVPPIPGSEVDEPNWITDVFFEFRTTIGSQAPEILPAHFLLEEPSTFLHAIGPHSLQGSSRIEVVSPIPA